MYAYFEPYQRLILIKWCKQTRTTTYFEPYQYEVMQANLTSS